MISAVKLSACRFVEFGTSVICFSFTHSFGSFLLRYVFKSPSIRSQRTKCEIYRKHVAINK